MGYDELKNEILKVVPNAQFEEDNDGQIIIYTNMSVNDDLEHEFESLEYDIEEKIDETDYHGFE